MGHQPASHFVGLNRSQVRCCKEVEGFGIQHLLCPGNSVGAIEGAHETISCTYALQEQMIENERTKNEGAVIGICTLRYRFILGKAQMMFTTGIHEMIVYAWYANFQQSTVLSKVLALLDAIMPEEIKCNWAVIAKSFGCGKGAVNFPAAGFCRRSSLKASEHGSTCHANVICSYLLLYLLHYCIDSTRTH